MEAQPEQRKADLRDYLAAERTLLAWIRTGLALMGFGFVVARFGLFLQEFLGVEHTAAPVHSFGFSVWVGIALIAAAVCPPSIHRHRLFPRRRRLGDDDLLDLDTRRDPLTSRGVILRF